jgi:hypothetical protein
MNPSAELHRLLDRPLPPETRSQLTNHLPMALHALSELGAGPLRLHEFADRYLSRFESMELPPDAEPLADWRTLRGQAQAYPALLATFRQALASAGRDAVLRDALPALLPGVSAAAFHGVIRTAHAIESGHEGELAQALAYWAWRWQPLAAPPAGEPMAFEHWAAALVEHAPAWSHDGPLISLRIAAAVSSAPYLALAGRLLNDEALWPRLTAFAAQRYADTRSFTVLHMVTGLRALRIVSPWVADLPALAPGLVHAATAAYLAAKVPAGLRLPEAPARGWDEVVVRAIASDDDHVVKIVHACRTLAALDGEDHYLQAARRAVA